jgi:hypothetical protein
MGTEAPNPEHRIALFQKKEIRRTLHDGAWWFVITDVTAALTDSVNPSDYLKKLRRRDPYLSAAFKGGGTTCPPPWAAVRDIRDELTDEWKQRGVKEQREYAILTAEISEATFGLTPSQYMALKGLGRENLRDHMNDLELIFSMLGEAATTEIARNLDAQGFPENKQAAHDGGTVAGNARKELEKKSGRKVVTHENFLALTEPPTQPRMLSQDSPRQPAPKNPRTRKP